MGEPVDYSQFSTAWQRVRDAMIGGSPTLRKAQDSVLENIQYRAYNTPSQTGTLYVNDNGMVLFDYLGDVRADRGVLPGKSPLGGRSIPEKWDNIQRRLGKLKSLSESPDISPASKAKLQALHSDITSHLDTLVAQGKHKPSLEVVLISPDQPAKPEIRPTAREEKIHAGQWWTALPQEAIDEMMKTPVFTKARKGLHPGYSDADAFKEVTAKTLAGNKKLGLDDVEMEELARNYGRMLQRHGLPWVMEHFEYVKPGPVKEAFFGEARRPQPNRWPGKRGGAPSPGPAPGGPAAAGVTPATPPGESLGRPTGVERGGSEQPQPSGVGDGGREGGGAGREPAGGGVRPGAEEGVGGTGAAAGVTPQGFSFGGGRDTGPTEGSLGFLGSQKVGQVLSDKATQLMDYLNRNTTDPTWDKDPRYEGVMGPARAAQQQAQQQAQGDSFIRRAVDKVIVNPTSRWISTVRSVQGLQREADKAEGPRGPGAGVGGTRHAHTDKARAIFDEAGAANERAEQQLNGFLDPLIRDETAGLSAANAGIKLRDLGTYGQALQQRDFDIHDMGSDKWNATVKTDPAMADIDAAANKGDSNALQMRANHMQIMGIEEWQRKLVTNEESTNYKGLGTKDIQDRIEVGEPHHQGAVDKIQQYFRTMLNEAEADGRISQELGDTLRKMYPRYVPVARIMDNIANHDTWGSTQPVGSLTKQGTIRQRGGPSSLGTENLLETVVSRTFQNQREAHRNAVGRELLRVASNYPGWENYVRRVSPEEIKKGTFKPDETNSISFLENGDQVILAVDPIIATAARNLQPRQFGMFVEGGRLLSRVLRTTATGPLNPVFQLSNLAMDALTNVENTGWRTLANAPRTAWAVAKDTAADIVGKKGGKWRDKDLEELKAHGAAFTSAEAYRNRAGSQIDYTVAKSRTGVGPKAAGMAGYVAKHPIDAANRSWSYVEDLFAKSEMASRLRVYVTARDEGLRQGLSQQEAQAKGIDAARNQMANYRHSGSEMAAFNAVTPYFNARLQNLASAWDAGRDDPRRFGMAIMGTIIAPAVAATIYNLSSPEKQRIYFDTPDDVKDDYLFFTGSDEVLNDNGRREVFKWPIPGQYSRLSKAVRMGVESLWRNSPEQFQKLAEEMGFQGMDFTPVVDPKYGTTLDSLWKNVGELGETALPQGTKFITDVVSGVHQYSGRPFVSKGLEGVPTSQQIDKDTGLAITKTAQALGLSPAYVQGVITSLGGQGIPITINAFDQVLQQAGLLPSDAKPGGVSTPESASARFLEGRGGRMKTIDKEGEAGKQEAGYGELMSQMTDGQRELLRQMRLPVKPVTPQEGDTPEVIALRHQLKGRLVGRMIDKVTSAPGWETLSPGDKRIKLQQEALVVSRFLSNRTTESGRLNPRQRMGYWQSQLNAHRR